MCASPWFLVLIIKEEALRLECLVEILMTTRS